MLRLRTIITASVKAKVIKKKYLITLKDSKFQDRSSSARGRNGKGMEKGKIAEVRNLIIKPGLTDEQAAEVAEVSMYFVKKIRSSVKMPVSNLGNRIRLQNPFARIDMNLLHRRFFHS